jgi:hypothetical protein
LPAWSNQFQNHYLVFPTSNAVFILHFFPANASYS